MRADYSPLPTYTAPTDALPSPPLLVHTSPRQRLRLAARTLIVCCAGGLAFLGILFVFDGGKTGSEVVEALRQRLGGVGGGGWRGGGGRWGGGGGRGGEGGGVRPKLRILHLVDKETSELLMDRWLLHSHRGFASRPDLVSSAPLWGPGFPGYDTALSLTRNVERHFGAADYFDAALVYFNNDQMTHRGLDPMPWFAEVAEFSRQGRGTVIIDRPHEMRDQRRVSMYQHANVTLVLAPYPSELFEYRQFEDQALLVHQPHFIDPDVFFHPVDQPRPHELIIAGDLGAFYPFRRRLADMILQKRLPGWIRGHPGYADIQKPELRPAKVNGDSQEAQLVAFGNDLANSKLCFVTSSRWQYSVQKYSEAAAAGCLILGTIPLDRSRAFASHIVPLSNANSDEHIISTVSFWLAPENAAARVEKARELQKWIVEEFGVRKYVEQVTRMVWAAREGQKGMVLPWEWHEAPRVLPEDG